MSSSNPATRPMPSASCPCSTVTSRCGTPPRQIAADGGYASRDNLAEAKGRGVTDVAFHKKRGLAVADMTKSPWVYRKLRNFRAGIEAGISCFKRAYGGARCTWRGLDHFKAYVWSAVVPHNLVLFARLRAERLGVRGGRCYTSGAVCTPAGEVAPIGAAPKEQPPRKLSGKRTAGGRALWKAAAGRYPPAAHRRSKPRPWLARGRGESLRVRDRGGKVRTRRRPLCRRCPGDPCRSGGAAQADIAIRAPLRTRRQDGAVRRL
jgi:hypothetical protein